MKLTSLLFAVGILAAPLTSGQAAPPVPATAKRIVVIADTPLTEIREFADAKRDIVLVDAEARKRGFVGVDSKDRRFLFSGRLWAAGYADKLSDVFDGILKAMDEHGVLDPSRSPALAEYLKMGFRDIMRFDVPDGTRFALVPRTSIWVSDGSRTIRIERQPPLTEDAEAKLAAQSLPQSQSPRAQAVPDANLTLPTVTQLHVFAVLRSGRIEPTSRMRDLADALKILADRYEQASEKVAAFQKRMEATALGIANLPKGLMIGMDAASLPRDISSHVYNHATLLWKEQGFRSFEDGEAFFKKAKLTGFDTRWSFVAARGGNPKSLIAFGLP